MDKKLMDKCLLTEKAIDKLWEKYEEEDPYQEVDWGGILIKAQLLKAYPIIFEWVTDRVEVKTQKECDCCGSLYGERGRE